MEGNKELLLYIYKNASMGLNSSNKLFKLLNNKDNKIKPIIEDVCKTYEEFCKKTKKYLKKYKEEPKEESILLKISSNLGMDMEVIKDNSDARMADMLIKGFTMGNVEIDKNIKKYKDSTDKNIIKLANELLKFGENSIEKLKKYL